MQGRVFRFSVHCHQSRSLSASCRAIISTTTMPTSYSLWHPFAFVEGESGRVFASCVVAYLFLRGGMMVRMVAPIFQTCSATASLILMRIGLFCFRRAMERTELQVKLVNLTITDNVSNFKSHTEFNLSGSNAHSPCATSLSCPRKHPGNGITSIGGEFTIGFSHIPNSPSPASKKRSVYGHLR
jgi:hypothetical protein